MRHVFADGIINTHNQHQWSEKNPHGVIHSRHQQQFIINVWIGGHCFVGQHICHISLQGNHYLGFLLHYHPKLLENVPVAVRAQMW
jgi:hypothetical protein